MEEIDEKEEEELRNHFFLDSEESKIPSHPLQNHPDWPYVIDPEIEARPYDDPFKEDNEPLHFDDLRVDPNKPDITYIPPWIKREIPPPTRASIRRQKELLETPCYIDDDPANLWLYKEPQGPFIATTTRGEWGAQGWKPKTPLNTPVKHVRFTYTSGPTDDFPEALEILQNMQKEHKEKGLADIAYNYLIGKDGAIYEGRGWHVEAERPEEFKYLKGDCFDIAYMGEFSNSDPPWVLLHSAMDILRYAVHIRVLDPNFKVIPFRPIDQQIKPK